MAGHGKLVCYSISLLDAATAHGLLAQFERSVSTLRRYSPTIPVVLFFYGTAPAELRRICADHAVQLVLQGDYGRRLADLCPEGWPVLVRYPALHKFLNYSTLLDAEIDQLLYCDCDTVFRDDVERLFSGYTHADLVAREEVHSDHSRYGPDPSFLDMAALNGLFRHLSVRAVPPYNSGVVLLNNRSWTELARVESWFVNCAWALLLGMARFPKEQLDPRFSMLDGVDQAAAMASPLQLAQAMPFPSRNQWILEEVAAWLAVGALPGLTTAHFSPSDVAQNGEFAASDPEAVGWAVCHYFSGNEDGIAAWLERRRVHSV